MFYAWQAFSVKDSDRHFHLNNRWHSQLINHQFLYNQLVNHECSSYIVNSSNTPIGVWCLFVPVGRFRIFFVWTIFKVIWLVAKSSHVPYQYISIGIIPISYRFHLSVWLIRETCFQFMNNKYVINALFDVFILFGCLIWRVFPMHFYRASLICKSTTGLKILNGSFVHDINLFTKPKYFN